MPGLSALAPRAAGVVGFGGLDDVGGRRFGGIRRVFGKASDLSGELGDLIDQRGDLFGENGVLPTQLGILLAKFSDLFFKFSDPSLIKLFFDRFHRPLQVWLADGIG
ncbi:MAG: hypothetical protein QF749_14000 [Verrucomicrobiota bacterium]|nr:hypothetical protein [Verrucomicrobiota bacterium]MDP7293025.1 hypothetical protein [Verrucomicrobiota bacterium]